MSIQEPSAATVDPRALSEFKRRVNLEQQAGGGTVRGYYRLPSTSGFACIEAVEVSTLTLMRRLFLWECGQQLVCCTQGQHMTTSCQMTPLFSTIPRH